MTKTLFNKLLPLTIFLAIVQVQGAELKPETVKAWNNYLQAAKSRNDQRVGMSFLWSDQVPGQGERLRNGEIVVAPVGDHVPLKVSSGLIHDWVGAAFLPNVRLADVIPVVRDYANYKRFYGPNVIDSKVTATSECQDRFSVMLMNTSVVSKTALDSDYQATYVRIDERHWVSTSETTRIQELAGFGTSSQRILPEDQGTGLIWRLYSFARFEERDGGVYVEVEALVLSRDVPVALRWMVDPIVRRVSRSSLTTSLQQTNLAVQSTVSNAIVSDARRTNAPSKRMAKSETFR